MEISTRVWSGMATNEGGFKMASYVYIFTKEEEKQQLIDCIKPLLTKKVLLSLLIAFTNSFGQFVKCGNCSGVFDAHNIESNKCIKCGSSFLIEYSKSNQQASRLSVMVPALDPSDGANKK